MKNNNNANLPFIIIAAIMLISIPFLVIFSSFSPLLIIVIFAIFVFIVKLAITAKSNVKSKNLAQKVYSKKTCNHCNYILGKNEIVCPKCGSTDIHNTLDDEWVDNTLDDEWVEKK